MGLFARCGGHTAHAWTFMLGQQEVLVVGLSEATGLGQTLWAQAVLAAHPDLPAILLSHRRLRPGAQHWNNLVAQFPEKVFMTAMGHYTEDEKNLVQVDGHDILGIEFDYQGAPKPKRGVNPYPLQHSKIAIIRFYQDPNGPDQVFGFTLQVSPSPVITSFVGFSTGPVDFSIDHDLDGDGLLDADDPCVYYANTQPLVDSSGDGIPDECQCGDTVVSGTGAGNGTLTTSDITVMNNCAKLVPPPTVDCSLPQLSDTDNNGVINTSDLLRITLAVPLVPTIQPYELTCERRPEGTPPP